MTYAAGALSKTLVGQSTAVLASAVATGGTGPYTYQWYRSQTTGFTPGAGNILSGQTALTLNDSGLLANNTYFYVVVATDTGNSNVTAQSGQLTVLTEPALSPNQFAQQSVVGLVDMKVGPTNLIAAQVDVSVSTQIYPGQAVKIVANNSGGIPKVAPCSVKSDHCIGFAAFNIKDIQYVAGQNLEVAMWGTVVWLFATGAITQFAEVCIDPTYVGGVQATGATATFIGWAFDGAAAAGMIRVMLMQNIAYATA
jgi:hypothetical protein